MSVELTLILFCISLFLAALIGVLVGYHIGLNAKLRTLDEVTRNLQRPIGSWMPPSAYDITASAHADAMRRLLP